MKTFLRDHLYAHLCIVHASRAVYDRKSFTNKFAMNRFDLKTSFVSHFKLNLFETMKNIQHGGKHCQHVYFVI